MTLDALAAAVLFPFLTIVSEVAVPVLGLNVTVLLMLPGTLIHADWSKRPVKPFTEEVITAAWEGADASITGAAIKAACRHLVSRGWECFKKLVVRVGCVMGGTEVVERWRNGGCVGRNLRARQCYNTTDTNGELHCQIQT